MAQRLESPRVSGFHGQLAKLLDDSRRERLRRETGRLHDAPASANSPILLATWLGVR
jgi:hypothetical protein